jgi:lipoprotein-anchoring transpeptidase ErfK/SrfK
VYPDQCFIVVSIGEQRLRLHDHERVVFDCCVSTARNGPGELYGSECTPRGWHIIRAKIGAGCPKNTVFAGRRATGETFNSELRRREPNRDWILTRILWLSGLERGRNRLGSVDTMRRYIYLHGCPEDVPMGVAGSHGCIRMRNDDVIALFERVDVGTRVLVEDD